MRRSEFDVADNPTLWITPFERAKSKRTVTKPRVYKTPLTPLALRIIRGLTPKDDLVFPGRHKGFPINPGSPMIRKLIKNGAPEDFTFHCARHTISTWLENKGHSEWERGLVLNHSGSGSVTAGYSHGHAIDLERTLLMKWSEHVERLVQPEGVALLR